MLSREVKDWLAEFKGLSSAELNTFISTLADNEALVVDLFTLFETPPYYMQELDPVCHQLYEFYRSKEEKLKLFSLQFVSTLVCLYLRCVSHSDKQVCSGVETFLLGVYNLEIVKPDGTPLVECMCIPSMSKSSVYHECRIPGVTEPLTEHALRSLNPSHLVWRCGPFTQYERFNAQNRFSILSFVMQRYNIHIGSFHTLSLEYLCRAVKRLCCTGFDAHQDANGSPQLRIPVSSSLLTEYLVAVYFAVLNGHCKTGLKAVEAAHSRASFELYSDVLLIADAIIEAKIRGHLKLEMLQIITGPPKTSYNLKNSITNASFKAKKLPEDIDFVEDSDSSRLATVEEDQEPSLGKGLRARLMNIGGKLGVDKNRNREATRRDSDTPSVKSSSGVELVDSVGVAVRNPGAGGGKVVIDLLEMQPIRHKGGEDSGGEGGDSSGGSNRNSGGLEGKQIRVSPSPVVFSKKSGVIRQSSHNTAGPAHGNSDHIIKTPVGYTNSAPSAGLPATASLSSSAFNGKATSGSSSSSISSSSNSVVSSIRQSSQLLNKNKGSQGVRAHSEGPNSDSSPRLPPLSSPSLLSSFSHSLPNSQDSSFHSNLSEPMLSLAHPPSSVSTHSIPADLSSDSSTSPSLKPLINQNSFSTNL